MPHEKPKMEWIVLLIAAAILIFSIIVNFFSEIDVKPAYYLFGTVASLVFGATIISKFK